MFKLGCTSDKIWNLQELIAYLVAQQNKVVDIIIYPEAVCLEYIGLYKILDQFSFKSVNIYTQNPFEYSSKYNLVKTANHWIKKQETIDTKLHNWNLNKKFFCLFGRPTAARLGIAGYLNSHYKEQSLIHFSANLEVDNLIQFELDKLLSYRTNSIYEAGQIINSLPILLSSPDRYTFNQGYYFDDPLTNFYQDILIDIVVESHVIGNTFFPTEKTFRPMWLKKPFIIFASRDYLVYLRQMGFRTFNDFWDEDYDGYEATDRFKKILKLLDALAKKSIKELESMYRNMQYTLDHNYQLLKDQSYQTKLERID